jgi:hypothetical protein
LVTPDDTDGESYTIPLRLVDALMTFNITLPTSKDLATLPILDITPKGTWVPSKFNDCSNAMTYGDPCFLAQTIHVQPVSEEFHVAINGVSG